jgi:hypothetical protein
MPLGHVYMLTVVTGLADKALQSGETFAHLKE